MDYISEGQIAGRSYHKTSTLRDWSGNDDAKRAAIAGAAAGTAAVLSHSVHDANAIAAENVAKASVSVVEHLIRGGLALSAATLGTSLFIYTHPDYTMQDFQADVVEACVEAADNNADAFYTTKDHTKMALESMQASISDAYTDFRESFAQQNAEETMLADSTDATPEEAAELLLEEGTSREEALSLIASNDALKVFKDEGELPYKEMISKIEKANRHAGIYDSAATAEEIQAEFAAGAETDTSLILSTAMGPMLYYSQDDSHWKDFQYGGIDPISGYGCGPTVCSMLINSFGTETEPISPVDIATWAADNKQYAVHSGSMHTLIPKALAAYGLQATSVPEEQWTPEDISNILKGGHVLVALVGPGTFTNGGHFLILTEESTGGKIRIADSNNLNFTLEDWDPQTIIDELNWSDASGAPLWEISRS